MLTAYIQHYEGARSCVAGCINGPLVLSREVQVQHYRQRREALRQQAKAAKPDLIAGAEEQSTQSPRRNGVILVDSDSDIETDVAVRVSPTPPGRIPADPYTTAVTRDRIGARTPPLSFAGGTTELIDLDTPAGGQSDILPLTAAPTEFSPTSPSYTPYTPIRYSQCNNSARSSLAAPHAAMDDTFGRASSLPDFETPLSFSPRRLAASASCDTAANLHGGDSPATDPWNPPSPFRDDLANPPPFPWACTGSESDIRPQECSVLS